MQHSSDEDKPKFGLMGFLLGVISLVGILIHLSAFFEPPEKSSATMIGEIAAEIKLSAKSALTGKPAPEPSAPPQDFGQFITLAALCAAGVAVALGGIGLYRNEPPRLAFLAVGLGLSALVMHYVFWLAILICAAALLVSIIGNLDSIFT
jgi:hypothetical protein